MLSVPTAMKACSSLVRRAGAGSHGCKAPNSEQLVRRAAGYDSVPLAVASDMHSHGPPRPRTNKARSSDDSVVLKTDTTVLSESSGAHRRPIDDVAGRDWKLNKRRKLASEQARPSLRCKVAVVATDSNGQHHIHYRTVDCAKSAISSVAELDCEDMGFAEWHQTYKAMRSEALVFGGGGDSEGASAPRDYKGRSERASGECRTAITDCDGKTEDDSLRQVAQSYMRCMQAFVERQAELTLTTLSTNTVKGDKLHAERVMRQYAAAHAYLLGGNLGGALSDTTPGAILRASAAASYPAPKDGSVGGRTLSLDMLLTAHKLLMTDLCASPGVFRCVPARCGNRHFVASCKIPGLMQELVASLRVVLARQDISMSAKAAWAMGHLLAIHPFVDGNGRLARLLANWVLVVSCGLPFAVVLCSSDSQRDEYIKACKSFHEQGTTCKLARVICAATLRAWQEFDQTRKRMMRSGQQDAEERATLDHIKRAGMQGCCIVCQEQAPDMITTCCAAPYHITCLTKWLVSGYNSSCCKCRSAISYQPPRLPASPSLAPPLAAGNARASRRQGSSVERRNAHSAHAGAPFRHQLHTSRDRDNGIEARATIDRWGFTGNESHAEPAQSPAEALAIQSAGEEEEGEGEEGEEEAVFEEEEEEEEDFEPATISDSDSISVEMYLGQDHDYDALSPSVDDGHEDSHDTTTTTSDFVHSFSELDDDDDDDDEEEQQQEQDDDDEEEQDEEGAEQEGIFSMGASRLLDDPALRLLARWRGSTSPPPVRLLGSSAAARRQPKCPGCQENQQASDCNFGVCGQCCRQLRRQARGSRSQACRRHPCA